MAELTTLERMEIQMAYAVPLLRDLEEILGAGVVRDALGRRLERHRERATERARSRPSLPMAEQAVRIEQDFQRFAAGGALTYDVADGETDEVAVDVHECGYAAMMDRLDATDLGLLLICGGDYAAAAAGGMELRRSQTKMEGASHCDFRFTAAATGAGGDGSG